MANFLQKVFNQISLQKDERLWMSDDDTETLDRLLLLAEFPETQFAPQLKLDCVANTKNQKLSGALREKGNLCYAQGETEQALNLYNQSLQFAPDEDEEDSKDLAITYANRSAVWLDKNHHSLALRDADFAFETDYPEDLHYKLYERKGLCFTALQRKAEAKEAFNNAVNSLQKSSLKGDRLKSKQKALEKLLAETDAKTEAKTEKNYSENLLPKMDKTHATFPSFCDAVEVKFEEGRGRFCVANRTIESGEIIAIEKPFVWLLDKEETRANCWHCFRPVIAPVPCKSCAGLVFCGPKCRSDASATYHKYECGITDVLYQAQIGGWALAYRAITSKPAEYFLNNKTRFSDHNELKGYQDGDVYNSEDILTFHNLVTHDKTGNKMAPELMMQALTAIFLLRCLKAKKYYVESHNDPSTLTDNELYLAKLIHHFMRVSYYNTHEITTASLDGPVSPERLRMRRIGRATNPTLALLNHSCDPNYRRVSVGRFTVGFATKTIQSGEEITDTYCPTFAAGKFNGGRVDKFLIQRHPVQKLVFGWKKVLLLLTTDCDRVFHKECIGEGVKVVTVAVFE